MLSQNVPFPVNPDLQVQLYVPFITIHLAFGWHGYTGDLHLSMAAKERRQKLNTDE